MISSYPCSRAKEPLKRKGLCSGSIIRQSHVSYHNVRRSAHTVTAKAAGMMSVNDSLTPEASRSVTPSCDTVRKGTSQRVLPALWDGLAKSRNAAMHDHSGTSTFNLNGAKESKTQADDLTERMQAHRLAADNQLAFAQRDPDANDKRGGHDHAAASSDHEPCCHHQRQADQPQPPPTSQTMAATARTAKTLSRRTARPTRATLTTR